MNRKLDAQDVCAAIRAWHMPDHEELETVITAFANKVQNCGCLGAEAQTKAVSSMDDALEFISVDHVNQQAEAMWNDSKQRRAA